MKDTWRARFAPAIRRVIREHRGQPLNVIRKALRDLWDAAGMGPRAYHPYKVFLHEANRQLAKPTASHPPVKAHVPVKGQMAMFGDDP